MNNENILNDNELENISGGKEVNKRRTTLVMDKNVTAKNISTVMKGQASPAENLVLNEKKSSLDGKLMAGDLGTHC